MWINGWSVDDFGHLRGTCVEGLTEGVNVVLGANESGKTTTLHFLRWVLFGFPRGNTLAVQRYRPGTDGFGGRVRVVHDGRTISMQRHYGDDRPTLSAADGSAPAGTAWNDVVGTAGRELFETVFAITTDELNSFAELSTDEVREHIYAAGMVGHGPSAREVLERLDDRRSTLLKPRSGLIRELHRELARRTEELHSAIAGAAGLQNRRADLGRLRAVADECDRRRRQLESDTSHLDDLIASWPSWSEATELRRELAAMPEAVELPIDPIGKLDSLTASLDAAARELDDAQDALRANTEQVEAIGTNERLPPLVTAVEELDRSSTLMANQENVLLTLDSTEQRQASQLSDALSDLGADWTVERTTAVDVSLPAFQQARELAERTTTARARAEQALSTLEAARRTDAATSGEMASLEARSSEFRAQVGPIDDVASAQTAAQRLVSLIPELETRRNAESDHARWEAMAREMQPTNAASAIPGFTVPTLMAVAILCVAAAGISIVTGAPLPAIGFALVSGVAGWLSLALHRRRMRVASRQTDDAPRAGTATHDSDAPRDSSVIAAEVRAAATTTGFAAQPTLEAANRRYHELDRLAALQQQLDVLRERSGLHAEELRIASQTYDEALAARAIVELDWDRWRNEAGLPMQLRPGDCVEFLDRVRHARNALEEHATTLEAIRGTARDIEQHRASVAELATRAGLDPAEPDSSLQSLIAAVRSDTANRRRIDELQRARPALLRAQERANEKHQLVRQELDDLLAHAGGDADHFRAVAAREESRGRITERLTQIDIELRARFGTDEPLEVARAALATGDLEGWKQNSGALETRRQEALADYEQAFDEYLTEEAAIAYAESSADVAGLSLQVEALRSELSEAMDDWTVATLAHKAIDDTLRRFETERQPEVVRSAAESFSRITDGRYTNLVPEEASLAVLEPGGGRLDSTQLSRGATEQLYLAMRFGLARQYARTTPLPLVLDDVLVNADPQRRRRLAEELHEVSTEVQVLLFTCHPGTAELLVETLRPGGGVPANIVEIPN
jgi:uncharacterized protein YhaN